MSQRPPQEIQTKVAELLALRERQARKLRHLFECPAFRPADHLAQLTAHADQARESAQLLREVRNVISRKWPGDPLALRINSAL